MERLYSSSNIGYCWEGCSASNVGYRWKGYILLLTLGTKGRPPNLNNIGAKTHTTNAKLCTLRLIALEKPRI